MPSTATNVLAGLSTSVAVKPPVHAVTSASITLSGWQVIGGVDLEDLNEQGTVPRVLVKSQSNPEENGIYVPSSGSWTRAKDFDGNRDVVQGTLVLVRNAVVDGAIYEVVTPNPIVIGTSDIEFELKDDPAITYPQTDAEIAAGVTPVDYARPSEQIGVVHLSRHLGWDPTGATSSHQAFANALELIHQQGVDHTEATQIGGRIIVPYGVALLSQTVPIGYDNIEIIGGHGATIRTNGAFAAFTVEAAALQKIYGVTIRGLRFTSTVTNRAAGSGAINVIDAEMLRILHCRFHLITQYGVRWENIISGWLQHCDFDSGDWNNPGMAYGLLGSFNATSGNNASHVQFNTFRRTTVAGVAMLGNELRSTAASSVRRECSANSIYSNDFEHNYGDGIQIRRNRALHIFDNWFEGNGADAASGHGHIMDLATDDDESNGDPVTSGLGAGNLISSNTFGGHDDANADFKLIGLKFQSVMTIAHNYIHSGGGILGITADCRGLVIRDNWAAKEVPTLAGALPTIRYFSNNRLGPADTFTTMRPWAGSFHDYDPKWKPDVASNGDTTPSLISTTFGRIHTLLLSNTGATSITYLDDGYEGMVVRVIAMNGNTTLVNGGDNALNLAGSANFVMATTDSITLMLIDTGGVTLRWIELGRSVN